MIKRKKTSVSSIIAITLFTLFLGFCLLNENFKKEEINPIQKYSVSLMAEEEDAAKAERIEELKNLISSFDDSLFDTSNSDGERTVLSVTQYSDPLTYPTKGQHPRLNINEGMLSELRALLEDPTYSEVAERFWADAKYGENGIRPDVSTLGKTYNYDGNVVARIEAMALAYLLTGDAEYGYRAIYAAKNHMTTLTLSHDIFSDIYRIYGWSMMVTAEVYDWCYDLMTETDRDQFIRGIQKFYCEDCPCGGAYGHTAKSGAIDFPPSGGNAIQGHATATALMRDYLSVAIAVFDEYPDWWEFVGGRFYQEFVPANNVFYSAGMNTQGTSNYVWHKLYSQLYSAWLIKLMSGEMPYDAGLEDVVYGLMGLRLPNGNLFLSGDGSANLTDGKDESGEEWAPSVYTVAQALFPSEIMQRNASILTNFYSPSQYRAVSPYISTTTALIFRSNGYDGEPTGSKTDGTELVWYYGSPMGQMTARDTWSDDGAAVFMKVGELTAANHDHEDAGTFQIYYKGCFTTQTGQYAAGSGYGTVHHKYWHQATISHNGILVYNTNYNNVLGQFAGAPGLNTEQKSYYSGGQKSQTAQPTELNSWLDSNNSCRKGTVTGYDYSYDKDGNVEFAYLAGDITSAYDSKTVDAVERRMLTVYTDDPDFPMFFFVYDYIKSDGADYTKSFLMHTMTEPVIDGNVATYTNGNGKIVLTNLTGGEVTKIGGVGKTYWVNDKVGNINKDEEAGGTGAGSSGSATIGDGEFWGRVQINNTGNKEDNLLNVIYVTDAANDSVKTPVKFESTNIIGTQIGNVVAAFAKTTAKCTSEITLSSTGDGLVKYHISGLAAGLWEAKVNGVTVAFASSEEESGLVAFTAEAGDVVITPTELKTTADSTAKIIYELNGGTNPEGAILTYTVGAEDALPTNPTKEGYIFGGWYTSGDFSGEAVTNVPIGLLSAFKVYAKWTRESTALKTSGITDVSVSLGTDLNINYYVVLPDGKSINEASVRFTTPTYTTTVSESTLKDGKYVFAFKGIGPHQVGMSVTAELLVGEDVIDTKVYSVEEYCSEALKIYSDNRELVILINQLLLYAKAAEKYHPEGAYTTGNFELYAAEYLPAPVDSKMNIAGNGNDALFVASAGMQFDTTNRIYFKIYSSSEDFTVKIGRKIYASSEIKNIGGGYYMVYSDPIYATDYDDVIRLTLRDGSGTSVATVNYSVNTYAYFMKDDADMKELAAALHRYGKACAEYANKNLPDNVFDGKDHFFS